MEVVKFAHEYVEQRAFTNIYTSHHVLGQSKYTIKIEGKSILNESILKYNFFIIDQIILLNNTLKGE